MRVLCKTGICESSAGCDDEVVELLGLAVRGELEEGKDVGFLLIEVGHVACLAKNTFVGVWIGILELCNFAVNPSLLGAGDDDGGAMLEGTFSYGISYA